MSAYTENSDEKSGAKENWEQGYAKCWEKRKKTKAKAAAPGVHNQECLHGTVRNQECLQISPMVWCVTRSAHVDSCSRSADENVFGEHKKQRVRLADKCDVWSHY